MSNLSYRVVLLVFYNQNFGTTIHMKEFYNYNKNHGSPRWCIWRASPMFTDYSHRSTSLLCSTAGKQFTYVAGKKISLKISYITLSFVKTNGVLWLQQRDHQGIEVSGQTSARAHWRRQLPFCKPSNHTLQVQFALCDWLLPAKPSRVQHCKKSSTAHSAEQVFQDL